MFIFSIRNHITKIITNTKINNGNVYNIVIFFSFFSDVNKIDYIFYQERFNKQISDLLFMFIIIIT